MYSTTLYLYQQIHSVLLPDTSGAYFKARFNPMYSKPLTINKGVDNVLLFEFINQDQKPVNITGNTFVFRLISEDGTVVLVSKDMTSLSSNLGRVKVVLDTIDTDTVAAGPASWSIERTSGDYVQAAYVDEQSGGRGTAYINDSVMPQFIPSQDVSIPTVDLGAENQAGQDSRLNWADESGDYPPYSQLQQTEFYSSHFATNNSTTTVAMKMDNFTGTVKAQYADDYQSQWYDVTTSTQYLNQNGWVYMNITGHYPLLRLAFNKSIGTMATATPVVSSDGVLTGITVTNGGSGYLAAPNVTIVGNGAGAEATAVLSGGVVSSVTVTNGGSGYNPITQSSTKRATVIINTGYILEVKVR